MRTIVDLPEDQVKALDHMGKADNLSRAELVRRAVDLYLNEELKKRSDDSVDKYFGFLTETPNAFDGLDGLSYEQKIRGEWDERDKASRRWGFSESGHAAYKGKDDIE